MTMRPHRTHCHRCGTRLSPVQRTKNARHPSWICEACGSGHQGTDVGRELEAKWIASGRPWLG